MSEFTVEGRKKEKQRTGWEDEGEFFDFFSYGWTFSVLSM